STLFLFLTRRLAMIAKRKDETINQTEIGKLKSFSPDTPQINTLTSAHTSSNFAGAIGVSQRAATDAVTTLSSSHRPEIPVLIHRLIPSWVNSLSTPSIKADMTAAISNGTVTYAGLTKVFTDAYSKLLTTNSRLTTAEFNDLKTIAANLNNGV